MFLTLSFMVSRSGRGDRIGRYGNTSNDHNFRDMDYRGYGQEDEEAGPEFEIRTEANRPYGPDEQSQGVYDFLPGHLDGRPGFHHRGDGRGDIGREVKEILWPPCSRSQPDLTLSIVQKEEEGSRLEFEQLQTGPPERGRGKGGRTFPENSAPHSLSREGNWGCGVAHPERTEYNTARQREEDRRKRRVSHNKSILYKVAIFAICHLIFFVIDISC